MKLCLNPTLCLTPANHNVCRARSQCCFPTVFSYVFISTGAKGLYLLVFWRWGRAAHTMQRLANCKKGKGKRKKGMRSWKSKPCVSVLCVCIETQTWQCVSTFHSHWFGDCVPACDYLTFCSSSPASSGFDKLTSHKDSPETKKVISYRQRQINQNLPAGRVLYFYLKWSVSLTFSISFPCMSKKKPLVCDLF